MVDTAELRRKHCQHTENALTPAQIQEYLQAVDGWSVDEGKITKVFRFKNYYETLAFVNAIAYMIHKQDHHPDLKVGYNRCTVAYNTHSANQGAGGISENDFICAARIDAIHQQSLG